MQYNKNEENLTVKNSSGQEALGTTFDYSQMLQKCTVSKSTANLLSCILSLNDLYDKVNDALTEMYGDERANDLIKRYDKLIQKLEAEIFHFFNASVKENTDNINFNEI